MIPFIYKFQGCHNQHFHDFILRITIPKDTVRFPTICIVYMWRYHSHSTLSIIQNYSKIYHNLLMGHTEWIEKCILYQRGSNHFRNYLINCSWWIWNLPSPNIGVNMYSALQLTQAKVLLMKFWLIEDENFADDQLTAKTTIITFSKTCSTQYYLSNQ